MTTTAPTTTTTMMTTAGTTDARLVGLRDLFLLRPGVVFLNHGSFGACPKPVFKAYQDWQLELERQPVEFMQRRRTALLGEARQGLGDFVDADADDLVYVTNVTIGLNIVARSLPLQPGDEVLTTDHEYGSLNRTWEFVCEKRGAHYVQRHVKLPIASREEVVEAVWSGVTDRTRVLFMSHITSPTALILPVEELVQRAREAGIITVIDGAHAAGQVALNLREMDVDFYSGNCHKWMMAPKGSAFLYARRDMQPLLEPLIGGRKDDRQVSLLVDEHQYQGTRDLAAFLAVPEAIRFMQEHDWPSVRQACHTLILDACDQVAKLTSLPPVVPDPSAWFSQMAVLPIPDCDTAALYRHLQEEFAVEVPICRWNGSNFVRLSVQGYTTRKDVQALIEGLATFLSQSPSS